MREDHEIIQQSPRSQRNEFSEKQEQLNEQPPQEDKNQEYSEVYISQLINSLQNAWYQDRFSEQGEFAAQLAQVSYCKAAKQVIPDHMGFLIQLLDEGSVSMQQTILEVINNIGGSVPAKCNFRNFGGFRVIVKLFDSTLEITTLALNAIGFLITREVDNAKALLDAEGIPPLVQFLGHENTRIKFFAAACTWVLAAYQGEFQEALLNAGAVPGLLNLLNCNHEDIAWQVAGALRNLVLKNTQVHQAVVNANGLDSYKLALLQPSSNRGYSLVIQTFVIISSSAVVREAMREKGLFPILLERIQADVVDPKFSELRSRVLHTFTNLCNKHKENQDLFRELGGIDLLIKILTTNNEPETIRCDAATTLWATSINNRDTLEYICKPDLLDILKSLLIETDTVLVGVVATVGNIAAWSTHNQVLLRVRNFIPLILDFMRSSHPPLLETAAGAIMSIIRDNDENINQLMEWDGPLLLAKNIRTHDGIQQNILGSLRFLLEKQFTKTYRAIISVDGLRSISSLLKSNDRPLLQLNAAYCILLIVEKNVKARNELIQMQIEYGINFCLTSSNVKLKSVTCEIITVLARHDEYFRTVLGEDVIKILVNIMKENNVDSILQERAIRALWAICLNNLNHQTIVRRTQCIHLLLELLKVDTTRVRTKGAILKLIAAACSKNYKNQEIVRLFPGAVDKIIECLSTYHVNELGEHAALAVWSLSVDNTRMKTAIRNSNGLLPLADLAEKSVENPSVLLNTSGAITALCTKCNANKYIIKETSSFNALKAQVDHDNPYVAAQIKELLGLFS